MPSTHISLRPRGPGNRYLPCQYEDLARQCVSKVFELKEYAEFVDGVNRELQQQVDWIAAAYPHHLAPRLAQQAQSAAVCAKKLRDRCIEVIAEKHKREREHAEELKEAADQLDQVNARLAEAESRFVAAENRTVAAEARMISAEARMVAAEERARDLESALAAAQASTLPEVQVQVDEEADKPAVVRGDLAGLEDRLTERVKALVTAAVEKAQRAHQDGMRGLEACLEKQTDRVVAGVTGVESRMRVAMEHVEGSLLAASARLEAGRHAVLSAMERPAPGGCPGKPAGPSGAPAEEEADSDDTMSLDEMPAEEEADEELQALEDAVLPEAPVAEVDEATRAELDTLLRKTLRSIAKRNRPRRMTARGASLHSLKMHKWAAARRTWERRRAGSARDRAEASDAWDAVVATLMEPGGQYQDTKGKDLLELICRAARQQGMVLPAGSEKRQIRQLVDAVQRAELYHVERTTGGARLVSSFCVIDKSVKAEGGEEEYPLAAPVLKPPEQGAAPAQGSARLALMPPQVERTGATEGA